MSVTAPETTPGSGDLAGARVVVSGAARGIGAAVAERFAAAGSRVAILDRLADAGRATAVRLDASFVEVDLAEPGAAGSALEAAIAELHGIDVLVNVAGVLLLKPLLETTPADWDAVMAVNARAVLGTMQAAGRAMIAGGTGGRIVNIASMAAEKGGANEGAYAASKSAVLALTRAAALEWGCHGIRVNAVCPGYVPTEMGAATRSEADVAAWCARSPLGRLGTPDDVASAVVFLASTEAGYLTGQVLDVSGGMMLH
jgi:NAD(P)-dependent dehydrogenase (short-subunit alcohol dehydrogenase family)